MFFNTNVKDVWLTDNGATYHITFKKGWFDEYEAFDSEESQTFRT